MNKIYVLALPMFLFTFSLRLLGENAPAGWVVGWGNNLSGQATGISDGTYATNMAIVAGRVLTPYSTGLVTLAGETTWVDGPWGLKLHFHTARMEW